MEAEQMLNENIKKAYEGRKIWLDLCKKYEAGDNDYFILMPSLNTKYNFYALLYLDQFIKKVRAEKIIILTYDERVKKSVKLLSKKAYDICDFSREYAELLMKFYCLYMFTDKLIIASLEEPEGRNGIELVGKKGITLEEIIAIGVYKLGEFERNTVPKYTGEDEIVKKFFALE